MAAEAAEAAVVEAAVAAVVEAAVAVAASGDVQAVAVAVLALEAAVVEASAVAASGGEAAAEVAVCRGEVATTVRRYLDTTRQSEVGMTFVATEAHHIAHTSQTGMILSGDNHWQSEARTYAS